MKIFVSVKPNSRQESVEISDDGTYVVRVNAPPADGRANVRAIELLAKFLDRPKSAIELIGGHKSKRKIFTVE